MVEGQMGLNWNNWQRMARAVEDLGFAGLYRSDHFTNPSGPHEDSLELWLSLTWLADHTERIDFGPMVTPMSFRNPVFTARMAAQVDLLADGRLWLGVGAGWQEREHNMFGFDLLGIDERFDRFEEALNVIALLLRDNDPVSYAGNYYELNDALIKPKSNPQNATTLLIGGNGKTKTLPLVAKFANAWNAVYLTVEQYNERNEVLEDLLRVRNRASEDIHRSMMTGLACGESDERLKERLDGRDPQEMKDNGMIVGTPSEVQEQLARLNEETNLQRVMLQWLDYDDLDGLEAFADAVL